jgi:hypothetical protein
MFAGVTGMRTVQQHTAKRDVPLGLKILYVVSVEPE